MTRSLSVPVIRKEKGARKMDSFFRIIPSTPRVTKDGQAEVANTSVDDGNFYLILLFEYKKLFCRLIGIHFYIAWIIKH